MTEVFIVIATNPKPKLENMNIDVLVSDAFFKIEDARNKEIEFKMTHITTCIYMRNTK